MSNKFKDLSKSSLFSPCDWFNFFGSFLSIFDGVKNVNPISETEVSFFLDEDVRKPTFKFNGYTVDVLKENPYDLATGIQISKFILLTVVKFKGDYFMAASYVNFSLMKSQIPYIRVGVDFYKIIEKVDRYGSKNKLFKAWKIDSIKQDHSKDIVKLIPRYDDFTLIPNNKTFKPDQNGCYNLYSQFPHTEHNKDVTINDIPFSKGIMNHIFGDQVILGFRYMKLLYEHPIQMLPILALVSVERGTGKTTFLNWINMLFGENSVLISPSDLTNDFNASYATKNIIMVDETVVEKSTTVEKLKSLATAKSISVSQKFVSQYSIPFYGKVILCTNKEKDFMKIDQEEIRFWVRKIKPVDSLNTNIEKNLFDEIPKFLKYLSQLPDIDFSKSRMVFTHDEIATDQLKDIKQESKTSLYKEILEHFEDYMNEHNTLTFEATPTDIKNKWFFNDSKVSANWIRKVLKEEFKLEPGENRHYKSVMGNELVKKRGRAFNFSFNYDLISDGHMEQIQ